MNLPQKEFDIVVSLGGNCSVACQLRMRGKRNVSFPLDWTLMRDCDPVKYLPTGFKTKFHDFCKYENIAEYEPAVHEFGKYTLHVRDSVSGYCFIHHFHNALSDKVAFEADRSILIRRFDRMYDRVKRSNMALFVLETSFEYDPFLLQNLRRTLCETFPSVDVYLAAMQFAATECSSHVYEDRIFLDRHERKVNFVYDNQFTAPEWSWMDSLQIKGMMPAEKLRKTNLFVKWQYKLWMALGKRLRDAGAGCANMRFRDFGEYGD